MEGARRRSLEGRRNDALPLVWFGALRDPSGYADEARAFLRALARAGHEPAAREFRWTPLDAGMTEAQRAACEAALARPDPPGPYVAVHHCVPYDGQPPNPSGPRATRTMFETDRIPKEWLSALLAVDEVWVPTEFNLETFQRGGAPASRLRILPGTLDFDLFDPKAATPLSIEGRRGFTFLTSFDFTDRKGWDVLLDAWALAFDPDDDVCLVLKCLPLHVPEAEIRSRIAAHLAGRSTAPVIVNTDVLSAAELPGLYAGVDAFVLASRGEGWGRPYMEAMAMGLPTIGSRFGGNLAFMHDGNSWLVDGKLVPVPDEAQRHTVAYRGHRWFEPDADSLAAALAEVARDPRAARARAARARPELLERFGPDVVAARIVGLAESLLERWQHRRRRPVGVVWRGEWGSCHSLATVNEHLVDALEAQGIGVERTVPASLPAPIAAVGVAQQWPPSFEPPSAGPFVLYQPWELGAVPASWVEQIRRRVDEVWVPSEYVRKAFVSSGVAPQLVHVVPNGVDLDRFSPDGPALELPARAGCVFLYVGGTIYRKGPDLLLQAYASAFTAADDVLLVIKSFGSDSVYRGMTIDELVSRFVATPGAPAVCLLDHDVPFTAMPSLYRSADVLVQPYRAEGFCLPALEALACGRPVIVTEGGPTDEFVPDSCAWRIAARRGPIPPGALPPELDLDGAGFLLEPDPAALAAALREAADRDARAAKAAEARAAAEKLGWEVGARIASSRLEALAECRPIRSTGSADVPGRRSVLIAALASWDDPQTWAPAVLAYARAFAGDADTTLALPADDPAAASALVERELRNARIDPRELADIVLVDGLAADPVALELAADAVIATNGSVPTRAARVLPADPDALRALVRPVRPLIGAR